MIALMQNTLPYIDADKLFSLISLPDALAALRACFAAFSMICLRCSGGMRFQPRWAFNASATNFHVAIHAMFP